MRLHFAIIVFFNQKQTIISKLRLLNTKMYDGFKN